jgi:hypothetical protein
LSEMVITGKENIGKFHLRDENIEEAMVERSWSSYYRVQAQKTGTDVYELNKNVEMLIGNESVTQLRDIEHFFSSFSDRHHPEYLPVTNEKVLEYCERAEKEGLTLRHEKVGVSIKTLHEGESLILQFVFDHYLPHRKKAFVASVELFESDRYCIFMSKSVRSNILDKFGSTRNDKVIEYTWMRNSKVDLVEFLLDSDGDISGRIIHPIDSLDWEEFIFCAYLLAVQADRLKYLVHYEEAEIISVESGHSNKKSFDL